MVIVFGGDESEDDKIRKAVLANSLDVAKQDEDHPDPFHKQRQNSYPAIEYRKINMTITVVARHRFDENMLR